ncbi:lamin tail domain-containing protein [Lysinibacter cavernae]|uniref:LTD domain-containing protein n=1 Tax=Lysinibacter cavernae TaxID=1640652 RepID=A0A7X5QZM8_9MICO|nr:lamin tail domain-containing protein [Lysinibacter cavernae]NIH52924.1 hypothetical protein [Lysinibacter cavernae]
MPYARRGTLSTAPRFIRARVAAPVATVALSLIVLPALIAAPAGAETTAAAASSIRINEVVSTGGVPGDWVELTNIGPETVDLAGYVLKDSEDDHQLVLSAGTTLSAGQFLAIDTEAAFGLGKDDAARLFAPDGVTLIDSVTWTAHASLFGRCPDGTGEFGLTTAVTKGAANACSTSTPGTPGTTPDPTPDPTPQPGVGAVAWPGAASVRTVDEAGFYGDNLSGLDIVGAGSPLASGGDTIWAVKNGPGTLYQLRADGDNWNPVAADGWAAGKTLHYQDGTGDVDAEGVVAVGASIYVSSERNNSQSKVSRPSVLRYAPSAAGTSLAAAQEWNLASALPVVAPNSGLEAIEWIPDAALVSAGFIDQSTGTAYDPARYAGHGDGLFFVGIEANGNVYAFALNTDGTFALLATISSGFPGIMDLEYEAESNSLFAVCDDTCDGQIATLAVGADGAFNITALYERPANMPNVNNEGFTLATEASCVNGMKSAFWSDDNGTDSHSLREGLIRCVTTVTEPTPNPGVEPVSEADLTDATRGTVTVPASVRPGEVMTVGVGAELANTTVSAILFSTPTPLGSATASAAGEFSVTIPLATVIGQHRLAVTDAEGRLLGWAPLSVAAAVDSVPAVPVATVPVTGVGAAAGNGGLAVTGAESEFAAIAGGIAAFLLGATVLATTRLRRRASAS